MSAPAQKKTTFQTVQEIIVDQLVADKSHVTEKARLVQDLGADSLDLVELVMCFEEEFGIEIQDEEAEGFLAKTIGDMAKALDIRIGNTAAKVNWNDNFLSLTDEQFIERYQPEKNENDEYYRQRDWTVQEDWEAVRAADKEMRAWTAVTDDDGDFCIVSGLSIVNRLYYIITEKPLERKELMVQVSDPEDKEDREDEEE